MNKEKSQAPIDSANVLSKLFLFWTWPIFVKGSKGTLTIEDIPDVPSDDRAVNNADPLERNLRARLRTRNRGQPEEEPLVMRNGDVELNPVAETPSTCKILLRALLATFGWQYFVIWPLMIFTDCVLRVIQPWFLLCLIRSFLEETIDPQAQFAYAAGVCLTTLVLTFTNNPCLLHMGRLGQRCRIALCSVIQRKTMRLSQVGKGSVQGRLVPLVTTDAAQFEGNIQCIPYILIGPLQLAIFMWFLWAEFGVSSLAGIGFILLFMPFQYWNGTMSTIYRKAIGEHRDERSRVLGELIKGINGIKMYAWEHVFKKMLQDHRRNEMIQLIKRSTLHAIQMSIFLTSSRLVPFLTFMFFVLGGGPLTADRVFYAVAVYNTATHFLGFNVPAAIRGMGEIRGSLQRIQNFLELPERIVRPIEMYSHDKSNCSNRTPPSIMLKEATANWKGEAGAPVFGLIFDMLDIHGYKLVIITGDVGAGKTSLFQLFLGELPVQTGRCAIRGVMSYADQVPWIFSGTIKNNIIFKERFDDLRYRRVIAAAGLEADLARFPNGDMTHVGDHGSALSGGQKARVHLARALYRCADIYLFDDPLSAVDARVSRHIFDNCFNTKRNTILEGKLIILITHQHQYLPEADHIVMMERGVISAQGTYEELLKTNANFQQFRQAGDDNVDNLVEAQGQQAQVQVMDRPAVIGQEDEDETQAQGAVGWGTYWKYFRAGEAGCQFTLYLVFFLISQFFTTFIEYWLALWTNAEERVLEAERQKFTFTNDTTNEADTEVDIKLEGNDTTYNQFSDAAEVTQNASLFDWTNLDQHLYLYVYSALTAAVFITNLAKAIGFFRYCMKASSNFHQRMLNSLVMAVPSFFDTNTSGRIKNRHVKDVEVMDEKIPFEFFDMFTIFLQIGTVIFLIILAIWYAVLPILLFLLTLWYVRRFYVATSRDLKRIDGITRSPILSQLTASFEGLTTIRACEAETALSQDFDRLQDINTASTFLFLAASRSFDIWIETIATILLVFVSFGFLLAQNYLGMTFLGGNVGLAICSAMSLTNWLQLGMRKSADVENFMISVERADEYTRLPSEARGKKPPSDWPSRGQLVVRDMSLTYIQGGQRVVNNLNAEIRPGERLGIVGRTGAGKSSIPRAIFRMTEPQGAVYIDGVNILEIDLQALRQNISIVPQEPVLFQHTLGFNLDPTGQVSDAQKQEVLTQLNLDRSLNFPVSEGGGNFCVGQRQLVSLAQALLRNSVIIFMDEATANIDMSTDAHIQALLRRMLTGRTVITIAHRLDTVIDSDRILVMDNGEMAELGIPHVLLQNRESHLSGLVRAAGPEAEARLVRRAEEAYTRMQQRL